MISFKLIIGGFTGGDERTGGSRQQQLLKMLVGIGAGGRDAEMRDERPYGTNDQIATGRYAWYLPVHVHVACVEEYLRFRWPR